MTPVQEVKAAIALGVEQLKAHHGDDWLIYANYEWILLADMHSILEAIERDR